MAGRKIEEVEAVGGVGSGCFLYQQNDGQLLTLELYDLQHRMQRFALALA
jgi:hypothetical protein